MKSLSKKIATITMLVGVVFTPSVLLAANNVYAPGDTVTIGEYIYNDDFSPNTGTCTVDIASPSGTALVSAVTMSFNANGWHYYNYTAPSTNGKYPAVITCGSSGTGDLIKESQPFIVTSPTLTSSSIASSVWSNGTRTITSLGSAAADVWNTTYSSARRLSDALFDDGAHSNYIASEADLLAVKSQTDTINWLDINDLSANLSNVVSEIGTGNISAIKTKTDTINWSDVTGLVTTAGQIKARTDKIDWTDVAAIKTATDTINWSDVTGISTNVGTIMSEIGTGNISAIKTKTDTINWSDVTGIATASSGIKAKTDTINWTDVTGIKTNTDTIAWSDVTAIKTKTDTIVWGDISTIKTNVASLISEVGTGNISAIKTATNTINWSDVTGLVTSTGAIKAKTDTVAWTDVTAIKTATNTINWSDVTGIKTKTDTIVWSDIAAIKAKTDTINWSDVATLLTQIGTGNISAIKTKTDTINWSDVTGIATASSGIKAKTDTINWTDVTGIKTNTDTIAWSDVTAIKTKTDTIVWGDISTIKTNVASLISEVGTGNISAIKTATNTINWSDVTGLVTSTGAIKAKTDTVAWTDVTAIKTATNTINWSDVTGIKTKTDTIVWSDIAAIKAKTDTINWSDITNLPSNVWTYSTRTLTSLAAVAPDVWNTLTSSLTTSGTIGNRIATNLDARVSTVSGGSGGTVSTWSVQMGNVDSVVAGKTYRTKVFVLDGTATPTDPFAAPLATVYDADRNVVASGIAMTKLSTGVYEYTYAVSSSGAQGLWETVVSTQVESGKTVTTNDYWQVSGSPAQVIINSINATDTSNITANVTITNEGLAGYEYQYEWCVVSDINNTCGGGDDSYYALAAKFINPSENWNTALTANVATAGTYYFKLVVHFGTSSSTSSRVFTVGSSSSTGVGISGGSSSSGGSASGVTTTTKSTPITKDSSGYYTADLNRDGKVNAVDFSILLGAWKKKPPYKNPRVDINKDGKVNAIDLSIMLYQWTK